MFEDDVMFAKLRIVVVLVVCFIIAAGTIVGFVKYDNGDESNREQTPYVTEVTNNIYDGEVTINIE